MASPPPAVLDGALVKVAAVDTALGWLLVHEEHEMVTMRGQSSTWFFMEVSGDWGIGKTDDQQTGRDDVERCHHACNTT